ncbi:MULTISPECIES: ROK family transcriptional regulator [Thalassospira]|uniref:ROK family transcriptional regulator n=2 Tax=Thalassospira lucentensis TaxID=168935 RepID=A0A358HPZ9_9PROT|nr:MULTISPECIES: ROK family transcriptional regulator [Thalassospira]HBU97268.1 ROK family transcriptional regulator [Thalassospira lucentensis]|tara:strand:- start:42921 stop:44168 length:1248 start_codon:yes stop_codon:yes gene_type:complete
MTASLSTNPDPTGTEDQAARPLHPGGGANQLRVRAYNERLVLSLVRRNAGLSKAEIARLSGLSAQTVSVIMRGLEKDGLLMRGEPVRGKVGKPKVPMALNPDGVYSFGLKIGRRSAELILLDFVGTVRGSLKEAYKYPTPDSIRQFVRDSVGKITATLSAPQQARIAGIGIAAPFELWNWGEEVGAPIEDLNAWREVDLIDTIGAIVPFPVFQQNDATAACGAELVFGLGPNYTDFAYFFIGSFIGGGVVLNQALYTGRTGNAGAFGSMPVSSRSGHASQLIDQASIFVLEEMLTRDGRDPAMLWRDPAYWAELGKTLDIWINHTARSLALAITSVCSVIDFEAVIVDGGFPPDVCARIVAATRAAISDLDLQGIARPHIEQGQVGSAARAIGAASLPLFSRYLLDQNVLFKQMQ